MSDKPPEPAVPLLAELLRSMVREPQVDPALARAFAEAEKAILLEAPSDGPFLTVLLRTQGLRIEPLRDALVCLAGQTVDDFEVILLAHSADPAAIAAVRSVVDRLEPGFASRVRMHAVEAGGRATPLNVGLRDARGRYVSVYDDDDLVAGHWVETFRDAAAAAPGRMIRALSANQSVRAEQWREGQGGLRTVSWPTVEFPVRFEHADHLLVNMSPFMTWAFPRSLFSRWGLSFDESLAVCEDWDVIIRGASVCGVTDVPTLTAIYRRWQDAQTSYSAHSRVEWLESEARVYGRLDSAPLLLPAGSVVRLREALVMADIAHQYRFLFRGDRLRQPLRVAVIAAQSCVRLAVRIRNRLRRMVGRTAP